MMKNVLLFLLGITCLSHVDGQKAYFQQELKYTIDVTLNDIDHTLDGNISIQYKNNSPDALKQIYMHLWGNAYKNDQTAFGREQLEDGKRAFHFSKPEQRGYYKKIDFSVNGSKVNWITVKDNPDIVIISLSEPLLPGKSIEIKTPFLLKSSDVFSRSGHEKQNYAFTQWYPKPAVYDKDGWHPMAYLDQGEFYSEFGTFDVFITLPENYIIASTGTTDDAQELNRVQARLQLTKVVLGGEADTLKDPKSSDNTKRLHYRANEVHDFAWFASKEFYMVKDTAILQDGTQIPTYGYFPYKSRDTWTQSAFYTKRTLEFLSSNVGKYPWPHASAVAGGLKAGGGMEYPMVTVIQPGGSAESVDNVIEHEVGHNWFYGILASNERLNPWMDEGINTFYENRYMLQFYPKDTSNKKGLAIDEKLASNLFMKKHLDQAVGLSSEQFSAINYGLDVYQKTAKLFQILEGYLGKDRFDKAMQAYFMKWKMKHPQPADLRNVLESETGENLGWLFEDMIIKNDFADYEVEKEGDKLIIENETKVKAPTHVRLLMKDGTTKDQWIKGFEEDYTFPVNASLIKKATLDPDGTAMDRNHANNFYRSSGFPKYGRTLRVGLPRFVSDEKKTSVNLFPFINGNGSDGFMLGAGAAGDFIPGRNFRWYGFAGYGFRSKLPVGQLRLEQNWYTKSKKVERIAIGVFAKRFSFDNLDVPNSATGKELALSYAKIAPFITIEMNRWGNWRHQITYRQHILWKDNSFVTTDQKIDVNRFLITDKANANVNTLDYLTVNNHALHPMVVNVRLEQQTYNDFRDNYIKLSGDWSTRLYFDKKKSFDVRVFGGVFLANTNRQAGAVNSDFFARGSFAMASTGADDYLFEGPYLDRTYTNSGIFSRQVDVSDGGFKFPMAALFGGFGYSNSGLAAINIKTSLPIDLPANFPIKIYADLGYFDDQQPINQPVSTADQFIFDSGFMIEFGRIVSVHFPVFQSKNLQEQLKSSVGSNYLNRITWRITLPSTHTVDLVKSLM